MAKVKLSVCERIPDLILRSARVSNDGNRHGPANGQFFEARRKGAAALLRIRAETVHRL